MPKALSFLAGLVLSAASLPALAQEPKVVATIPAVHSLVSMVTQGVAEPELVMAPGNSFHDFSLRPSHARALQEADLVFWIGAMTETWAEKALATLPRDARIVALADAYGTRRLDARSESFFESRKGNGPMPGEQAANDLAGSVREAAGRSREDSHGHAQPAGGAARVDPHLWLDPNNAVAWLASIANAMADADPVNSALYEQNAAAATKALSALERELTATLEPVSTRRYVVFHDAYQYLETSFGLDPLGTISLSDSHAPGLAHIKELRERILAGEAVCMFTEPQFDTRLAHALVDGSDVRLGLLDPIGIDLEPGPGFYPALLRDLATALTDCLAGPDPVR